MGSRQGELVRGRVVQGGLPQPDAPGGDGAGKQPLLVTKRYLWRFTGMDPANMRSYLNLCVHFFRVERDDER